MILAKDPEVGDPVFVRGTIVSITEGIALVRLFRSWPLDCAVGVQCGALELDERAYGLRSAVDSVEVRG